MPSLRLVRLVSLLAALPLFLVACGGGGGGSSGSQTLTDAYPAGWAALDPSIAFSSENDVLAQVYETLTVFNPANGGKITPNLATSWEHNADGTVWTFHLRKGVKFQDGSDFNANAVKFTIERNKKLNQGAAFMWEPVTSIDVVDPLTVKLNLSTPAPMDLISAAAWGSFMLSPKSDNQPSSWFNKGQGIGTGPYMWQSYKPNQSAVLTKFSDYWGGWHDNQFTKILYNITADATTRQSQLLSGNAQVAQYLGLQQLKGLERRPNIDVHSLNTSGIYYMSFNMTKPPLTDVRVRQALAYSFPHDQVMKTIYGEFATKETSSLVPDGMWGHTDLPGYSFDLAKAKSLLAAAGHPKGGFKIEMVYVQYYPQDAQIGELWKPILAQLGINLTIRQISTDTWLKYCCSSPGSGPEIMTANWPPTYPSPYDYLYSNFVPAGPGGTGSYYDSKADAKLLAQGLTQSATDQTAAADTFATVQNHILGTAATIPIVDYPMNVAAITDITNFTVREATLWIYGLRTK